MKIEVSPDNVDTYKADSRGRINLGVDHADKSVEIAILDTHDQE